MPEWFTGHRIIALAILLVGLSQTWVQRYETIYVNNVPAFHKNRLTGVVCRSNEECWLTGEIPAF